MNLETKITIYKFTPQLFTLTHYIFKENFTYHTVYQSYTLFFINYSSLTQSRAFQGFFNEKAP